VKTRQRTNANELRSAIEDMIHRPKFKPIALHLNDGTKVPVKHPDFLMFTEGKKTIVVTEGEHIHIVDVESITAIKATR
jgi:hypothetical protein